ncbi:MAG: hypothetical protein WD556_10890 [Actinomycetota bacterium]
MKLNLRSTAVALTVFSAVSVTGLASAGNLAETTVTINEQSGDFSGTVRSNRPNRCADERKIVLFKQKGREQRPSRDRKVANDTASLNGDRYEWNTGNTGFESGKFYARAGKTPDCQPDNSKTVRVS